MPRYVLRHGSERVPLPRGRHLVGRDAGCSIRFDDPMCSRVHAVFRVGDVGVEFEDLGSRNGSTVNGKRSRGACAIVPGDRILVGVQELELAEVAADRPTSPSIRVPAVPLLDIEAATRHRSGFTLLAGVAQKALAGGRVEEGERILRRLLTEIGERIGPATPEAALEDAARHALRLAEATSKTEWVDWVFEAYRRAGRVLPGALIDGLHGVVRTTGYRASRTLGDYADFLRDRADRLSASERFLTRRIEGLWNVAAEN